PKFQSFGVQTVDTFRWRRFNLENLGNVPLQFSASLIGRDATSFKIGNSCRSPLAVGQTCSFVLFFHPMTVGDKAAQLRVVVGDDVRDRPLSGTGVPGSFTVTPTSIAFGGIAIGSASDARIVTVTNTGQGLLPIESVRLDGARPGQFVRVSGCEMALRAGESCHVTIYFVPKLKGPLSALLVIDAGGLTEPKSATLTGKGL
ncbi:MAG TPA: choice-of-anchor D domain-containing protein, partial [Steroidobacteraceae bacterium]|nr:choice-of-anchor D domain-containing protein [Steroidobacteraceae bacterium]